MNSGEDNIPRHQERNRRNDSNRQNNEGQFVLVVARNGVRRRQAEDTGQQGCPNTDNQAVVDRLDKIIFYEYVYVVLQRRHKKEEFVRIHDIHDSLERG